LNYVSGSAMVLFSNGTAFAMEPVVDGNELIWDLHDYFLQTGTWLSVSFDTLVDIDAEEGLLENKVNVSGKACTQTYYELEDTATVYVVMTDNVPPVITARSPADGSSDIDIDAVLSVLVTDPDNDMLTVVFYDGSDDSVIKEVSSIIPPETVTFTWENLAYLTTYEWYVTVSDGIHMITSPMWNFTTIEEPINRPPHPPTNPNPANNTQNVIIHPTLSVQVSDPDGDMLTVYFYDGSTHTLIGHVVSQSGRRAITKWTGLTHGTTYSWYVRVNDGEFNVTSETFSFTTKPMNIELDVEVSGGMGVTVEFINRGMDAAGIVGYEISVKSEGLLNRNRIDRSTNGTVNLPYNSVRSERIWLFNSGRITIDVSVTHPLLETPLTKRVDGILFGFFVIIHN
ncbi:MAG: Ig-like domain-containing protein, partial [Candidatus Thermoplasmatota archaeon]|nr:Ig-like domain-containing protein [Candidatus Thermoplasmatota archaeon]